MMWGAVLGLRACDVIVLKLADIDWLRGEIRIVQSKTSNPAILPLTQDVGEALKDYVLNARPSAVDNGIFLRIKALNTKLAAAMTVGEIYRDCCIAAGLPANKRFHNLRRSLGTSMVTNGALSKVIGKALSAPCRCFTSKRYHRAGERIVNCRVLTTHSSPRYFR